MTVLFGQLYLAGLAASTWLALAGCLSVTDEVCPDGAETNAVLVYLPLITPIAQSLPGETRPRTPSREVSGFTGAGK